MVPPYTRVLAAKRNDFLYRSIMEKVGRYWPTESDKAPRVVRLHVRTAPSNDYVRSVEEIGITTFIIEEQTKELEGRLKREFPLYRMVQWGRHIIGMTGEYSEV
jgi:hypothetical protein